MDDAIEILKEVSTIVSHSFWDDSYKIEKVNEYIEQKKLEFLPPSGECGSC